MLHRTHFVCSERSSTSWNSKVDGESMIIFEHGRTCTDQMEEQISTQYISFET